MYTNLLHVCHAVDKPSFLVCFCRGQGGGGVEFSVYLCTFPHTHTHTNKRKKNRICLELLAKWLKETATHDVVVKR